MAVRIERGELVEIPDAFVGLENRQRRRERQTREAL
jgi:hypothetical protein